MWDRTGPKKLYEAKCILDEIKVYEASGDMPRESVSHMECIYIYIYTPLLVTL